MSARVTNLAELATRGVVASAASGAAARSRTVPLLPALAGLVPEGVVQRGSVVACSGVAAVSLALALAAGPSQQGAWVGVAGLPGLGLAAAAEAGVALDRLVQVAEPAASPWADAQWGDVLAALVDGFDVVLLGPGVQRVRAGTARRFAARLQARSAVAVTVDVPMLGGDLHLRATAARWAGLGQGHGVARAREVVVELAGRRVPRARRASLWLPASGGGVQASEATTVAPATATAEVVHLRHTG